MQKCNKPYEENNFGISNVKGYKVIEGLKSGEEVETEYGLAKAPAGGGVYDVYALVDSSNILEDFKYVRRG